MAQPDPCSLQSWDPFLPAPEKASRVLATIDLDGDQNPDCDYQISSDGVAVNGYLLDYQPYADRCVALGKSTNSPAFKFGDLIGLPNQKPFNSSIFPTLQFVLLQAFRWVDDCRPFGCYRYSADEDGYKLGTVGIFGMRLQSADGYHYAWIKFSRPCNRPWVPFVLDSYATHPLPNTPIPAGVVPQPELVVERGPGTVTLSWRPEWQGYRLEWLQILAPTIAWKPVEGVVNNRVTLPANALTAYFRLAKEP